MWIVTRYCLSVASHTVSSCTICSVTDMWLITGHRHCARFRNCRGTLKGIHIQQDRKVILQTNRCGAEALQNSCCALHLSPSVRHSVMYNMFFHTWAQTSSQQHREASAAAHIRAVGASQSLERRWHWDAFTAWTHQSNGKSTGGPHQPGKLWSRSGLVEETQGPCWGCG